VLAHTSLCNRQQWRTKSMHALAPGTQLLKEPPLITNGLYTCDNAAVNSLVSGGNGTLAHIAKLKMVR
jgi:hypothetical protein